ncbi:MsnO8 family LLM class oxidoreductase [Pseudactinotalea sp. Z1732]|uniref:MsnO8 family LLM class oxidoreductase n=1 Tax=Micrococcales TaxID=85006 RepID=UPI003C7C472F
MSALKVPVSLLDRSRTRAGEDHASALWATVERARHVEDLGHHRFWVAEHHAVPGIASGSPAVLIASVAARTDRIRVGSGGVMLPNHRPILVAEQFKMLQSLHPGRIDLGLGRSLGFTAPVRQALGVTRYPPEQFEQDIAALRDFLSGNGPVTAMPASPEPPPLFVLTTGSGLEVAARAGLPVVVGGPALREEHGGLATYREQFRPSAQCPEPQVIISLDVMVAETTERARELLLPEAWAMADSQTIGAFPPLSPVEVVRERVPTAKQARTIERTLGGAVYGTAAHVQQELAALIESTGAAEVLASTSTYDRDDLAGADAAVAALFTAA